MECGGEAKTLGDDASEEDAEPHAEIPRDEDGGVGGAALIVAGYFDKHVEEGGIHLAVAETDADGGGIEGPGLLHEGENGVSDQRKEHAYGGVAGHASLAQAARTEKAGDEESRGEEHEEDTGAVGDAEPFLAVEGHIVAHHTPAEAEEADVDGQEPCPAEEEVVEAEGRFAGHLGALGQTHLGGAEVAQESDDQRKPEKEHEIAGGMIDIDARSRGDGHGEIIAKSVESKTFVAPLGGEDVDGGRAVGHGGGSEGKDRKSVV